MTHRSPRRGVAAIEFILTVPIMLLVFFAVVEISLLMHRTYVTARAARDGCRTGAGILEGPDPTGEQLELAARQQAELSLLAAGISCGGDTPCTITADWREIEGWMTLRVDVSTPYEPLTGLFPGIPEATRSDFVMITRQQIFED